MIGKEVHLSDSEESSEDQPDEVVEKPPTLLAAPSHSMIVKEVHLSDSEESSEDQPDEVVEKPPTLLAAPSHSVPQLPGEGSQQDIGEVKRNPSAQNELCNMTSRNTSAKPLELLKRIIEAARKRKKSEKEKKSSVAAAPSISQEQKVLEEDLHPRDSEDGHDDHVVEKPPCSLAGPWHSGPQLLEEGNQQEMGEVKLHPCAQNSPWKVTRKITCGKPLQLLKRIMEAERMAEKVEKEKMSLVGAAPSSSQKQTCSEKEEISVGCAATNLSSERNMIGKEVHLSDSEESSEDQPDEVVEKPPTLLAAPSHRMLEEDLQLRDSEGGHDDQQVVEKPPCSLAGPWHSGPQLLEEGNQQEMGEVKLHPCAQNSPWKVTRKITCGKPLQLLKRIMEAERMAEKVEKEKMSLVGAAPSSSQKQTCSEKEEISVGCAATNLSSERNMIGKEVHLSDSEESSEDQPDEVVEKPPTLLAAPSHRMLEEDLQLRDSEGGHDDQVVEKPPCSLAGPWHSGPQLLEEGNQQEMGEVKLHPCAQNSPWKVTRKITCGKPLQLLKRIMEAERMAEKVEKEKMSLVGAAPSSSQKQTCSEKEEISVGCAATNLSSERNMIGKEVHLSDSEESSEDQPDEVVEKPPTLLAAPSHRMLEEDLQLRDSEGGHDDQQVVEKPPCSLAGPWHSGPQLLEEGNQQEMGEVKLHPCAQNSPWKVTRKITCGKPLQLLKKIMEAESMEEKLEKVKISLVGAAPSTSQKREWSEKEEISVGCAATNLSSERNGRQVPAKSNQKEMGEAKQHPSAQRQPLKVTPKHPSGKPLEKRKREKEGEAARKKLKSEKEAISVVCAATNLSSERNGTHVPAKRNQKEMGEAKQHPSAQRQPLKVTPKNPSGKPLEKRKREKEGEAARKKLKSEKEAISVVCAATNISSERNGPQVPAKSSQQEMGEAKQHPSAQMQPSTVTPNIHSGKPLEKRKGSTGYVTKPFPVPECSSRLSRPHLKAAKKQQVKYYQEEVKRLKGKADAMPHFIGKGIQYLDAALCFAEYGMGLEWDAPPPRSASHIFRETIELIRLITTMKSFVDSSPTPHEEILLLLCMRCQSLLHMAMLQHKRDTAMKYCGILSHHFESSSRATRAPSASAASSSATRNESAVSVPTHVPLITSSYLEITSSIFPACDTWDEAEVLARKNKELFAELSAAAGSLALNSSVRELVRYARQALQWLRRETNTP
ncbi:AF4/FMR2 family member 1-like isoform X3 [Melanerpes formicivorus]|uniref:AF4/FMR2 family member 1-like isoform X3 n=1 Tax=Melanerpes formicivorus TaxID=211600 RepID=UPI00358F8229